MNKFKTLGKNEKIADIIENKDATKLNIHGRPITQKGRLDGFMIQLGNVLTEDMKKGCVYFSEEIYCPRTKENIEQLKDLAGHLTNLEGLDISYMPEIKEMNLSLNEELKTIDINQSGIESLKTTFNTKLERLRIDDCENLKEIKAHEMLSLQTLIVRNTPIENIGVEANYKLERVTLRNVPMSSLDVTCNNKLKELYVENTHMTSLDVTKNENLARLSVSGNQMKDIDVTNNKHLYMFDVSHTPMKSVDISQNKELESLYCHDTKIASLDTSNNYKLGFIIPNADIKQLDISNNPDLYLDNLKEKGIELTNLADDIQDIEPTQKKEQDNAYTL